MDKVNLFTTVDITLIYKFLKFYFFRFFEFRSIFFISKLRIKKLKPKSENNILIYIMTWLLIIIIDYKYNCKYYYNNFDKKLIFIIYIFELKYYKIIPFYEVINKGLKLSTFFRRKWW